MNTILDIPLCDKCSEIMVAHYDNTGFTPPEGAPHWEVDYYECPICGRKDTDQDEAQGEEEDE